MFFLTASFFPERLRISRTYGLDDSFLLQPASFPQTTSGDRAHYVPGPHAVPGIVAWVVSIARTPGSSLYVMRVYVRDKDRCLLPLT